jgi:peptidoglycan hydrolase-like protein with peptidoglycan-binding domain
MNRKIIIGIITPMLLAPSLSLAEMLPLGEAEIRAKITALLAEVSALQRELDTTKMKEENGHILQTFRLLESLTKGTRSDEVKTLQTLLAEDPQIYPEGYVTGYYGTLTSAAVERFKNKHAKPGISVESIGVPHIFEIAATTTKTTMTVAWKTDVPTSAKIWWGSPGPLDAERMTPISTTAFSEDHRALFTGGIFASTTYAFIIAVSDKDGNTSTTTEQIYVTP